MESRLPTIGTTSFSLMFQASVSSKMTSSQPPLMFMVRDKYDNSSGDKVAEIKVTNHVVIITSPVKQVGCSPWSVELRTDDLGRIERRYFSSIRLSALFIQFCPHSLRATGVILRLPPSCSICGRAVRFRVSDGSRVLNGIEILPPQHFLVET